MTRLFILISVLLITITLLISSCTKPPIIPGTQSVGGSSGTATITFNGNDVRSVDSVHWDYYSSFYRLQAFNGSSATFTLYMTSIVSGTRTIPSGYLFWLYQGNTYSSTSGTLLLTNTNNILSGSFSASGYSSPYSSPISVTFSDVKQLGL